MNINEIEKKLNSFVNLRRGWDSYDAPVPSIKSINKARDFTRDAVQSGIKPSRVAPSVVGGVGITWQRGDRRVYMEFLNTNQIGLLFEDFSKDESESEAIIVDVLKYDFDAGAVAQQIKNFLKASEANND